MDAFGKRDLLQVRTEALPQILLLRIFCIGEAYLKVNVKLRGV